MSDENDGLNKAGDPSTSSAQDLRRRAEEIAREKAASLPAQRVPSPEEVQQMFHELQVRQIELEMQNDELRRTQRVLETMRTRYFDLYDLAPVGYCTVSEEGLILEANLTAAALLGAPRSARAKWPLSQFVLKEDQDLYYRHRKLLFETGEPQACDLRMQKREGPIFWAHLEAIAAKDAEGVRVGRVVISDITVLKRSEEALRESEERTRAITDSAQDAIIMMDTRGSITYWNPSAERILGYTGEEALGKNLHQFLAPARFHAAHAAAYSEFLRTGKGGAVGKTVELAATRKDGVEITVSLSLSAVKRGDGWHAVGILRDITGSKKAEEILSDKMRELKVFYEASIGREERIIALKEEVRKLKEKERKT